MIVGDEPERCGPTEAAALWQATVERLTAERDQEADKGKRSSLNRRIRSARGMVRFCKSRQGYAATA
jgi:hypothetical protein